MRIGIDCRLWDETGVGRYIRNLVRELNHLELKHDIILFHLSKDSRAINDLRLSNRFTSVVSNIRWHSLEEQTLLPQIIRQQRVDLMHFPYFSVPVLYTDPFVVTIHDLILSNFPTGEASTLPWPMYTAKRYAYDYVINSAIKRSEKIIVPLYAVKKDIEKKFSDVSQKIAVTYEGIEDSTELRSKQEAIRSDKYFLHVGNVYPHKNCELLVDGFSMFLNEYPNVHLIFVGKKDFFMERLEKYVIKNDLKKSVSFVGKITDAQLNNYYAHAMGLIIPSLMEGFGLPALEAMSQLCLVLASDIPSLREVCEDNALYYDPNSAIAIANTMRKAIQLPAIEKDGLIQRGLVRCKDFSWQHMAEETLALYESSVSV